MAPRSSEQASSLIYLDHPTTSWPKPPEVGEALLAALDCVGSPARGTQSMTGGADRLLAAARHHIARYLGITQDENLIFVPGATFGLNMVLKGFLEPGDRAAAFIGEHNAVTRPLGCLIEQSDIELRWIASDDEGYIDVADAEAALHEASTKALICQQASNVTGALQPISELATLAHAHGAALIVDGAQAAGHIPLNLEELGVDAWVCSGHKALGGPAGSGLVYLAPEFYALPLITGGTGTGERFIDLFALERPSDYEVGTLALPSYLGLAAAVKHLRLHQENYWAQERKLITQLVEGLVSLPGMQIIGPHDVSQRIPLVTCYCSHIPADQLAFELDRQWHIASRAGRQCAPALYDALNLDPAGALRFGVGPHNTEDEISRVLQALSALLTH